MISAGTRNEARRGGQYRQAAGATGPHSKSERHPMLAGKATDFFDLFNNARDFTIGPQKGRRSHA